MVSSYLYNSFTVYQEFPLENYTPLMLHINMNIEEFSQNTPLFHTFQLSKVSAISIIMLYELY